MTDTTNKEKKSARTPTHKLAIAFKKETYEQVVYYQGRTLVYDGKRYVEETEFAHKVRLWLVNKNERHDNQTVSNVVADLQAIYLQSVRQFPSLPFFVGNGREFGDHVINYDNGLLDVEQYIAGKVALVPHTKRWVSTFVLPYSFDENAACRAWEAFMNDVFDGDAARISLLQEWFGYTLLPDVRHHKMLIKMGPPRAGKGTTDRIHEGMLGSENTTGFSLYSLADKFGLRRLLGRHVAFVGEVTLAGEGKPRILETLNAITGGDPVPIEEKYNPQCVSVTLPTRFSISCNEMPSFVDPSGALSARLLVLNYNKSFVGREDRGLVEKLLGELPGINRWALDGLRRLRANGRFTETDAGKDLANEFRRNNSDAFSFMQDFLVIRPELNPGNLTDVRTTTENIWITGDELRKAFARWCNDNGRMGSVNWIERNLRTLMPKLQNERKTVDGRKISIFPGIGLAS